MKLNVPNLKSGDDKTLVFALMQWLRSASSQINATADGRITAYDSAQTAAPSSGTWQQGDFVLNKTPSELGSAGSKYIIHGWRCVTSGTPGAWVQCRMLTGN
ncbi:hypothetical protein HQ393_04910 [Chitinibacter bivalviorum]|uniref:Uncharacterized protein n=1 Tax=Chitinibacter bivalviorum TaxID=2739434 RepID=A0A7H9BHB1_9NEIS|nr:hypothetical protein [Chitinibacter bivalviorum]QLG87646.1 hypothetical protein HQ393_04910 [Chitinibacter bivalviorum]